MEEREPNYDKIFKKFTKEIQIYMEEFEDLLIDGEFIPVIYEDILKLQELLCFTGCTLDVWDDITCDERDLKNIILTEGMSFIGKGKIKLIKETTTLDESPNDSSFKLFKGIIISGTFDAIMTNGIYRKFYI